MLEAVGNDLKLALEELRELARGLPVVRLDDGSLAAERGLPPGGGRGDTSSDADLNGSAFEKVDAFRSGVLGGMQSCQDRITP